MLTLASPGGVESEGAVELSLSHPAIVMVVPASIASAVTPTTVPSAILIRSSSNLTSSRVPSGMNPTPNTISSDSTKPSTTSTGTAGAGTRKTSQGHTSSRRVDSTRPVAARCAKRT